MNDDRAPKSRGSGTRSGTTAGHSIFGDRLTAAAAPERLEWQGVLLGERYRIEGEAGRGGQGIVYRAHDLKLDRAVAVKALRVEKGTAQKRLDRFEREGVLEARLDHPNIAAVYDAGIRDGVPYLVMRWVDGETLGARLSKSESRAAASATSGSGGTRDRISREALPMPDGDEVRRLARIFAQAARALHVAHEHGVIHRDLKPHNIMITSAGDPVILDFGMARAEADDASLTETGDVVGTPPYMSPEQIDPARGALDRRSDVYSLSVTLYESLTSARPFNQKTVREIYAAILRDDPRDPRTLNPAIPEDLAAVVLTGLAKERESRYADAAELADDLSAVAEGRALVHRRSAWMARWRAFLFRGSHRGRRIAAAIFVAALAFAVGLRLTRSPEKPDAGGTADDRAGDARAAEDKAIAAHAAEGGLFDALDAEYSALVRPSPRHDPVAIEAWIVKARALAAHRAAYEEDLAVLHSRAGEASADDRNADQAIDERTRKEIAELEAEAQRLYRYSQFVENLVDGDPSMGEVADHLDPARARVLQRSERLKATLGQRHAFRFASPADSAREKDLRNLIDRAGRLLTSEDPFDISVPVAAARLAVEKAKETEIDADCGERWVAAARAVNERYPGLGFTRQPGLSPLGADPANGTFEFIDRRSGAVPPVLSDGSTTLNAATGIVFVLVPGGQVRLPRFGNASNPFRVKVEVAPFLISKFELSQAQYLRLSGRAPSYFTPTVATDLVSGRLDLSWMHPVENVNWDEAETLADRFGYRLPTLAQATYAAAGGTNFAYPWGDDPSSVRGKANIADLSARRVRTVLPGEVTDAWDDGMPVHAPITFGEPNGFGLMGISGNVAEWTSDRFATDLGSVRFEGPSAEIVGQTTPTRFVHGSSYLQSAAFALVGFSAAVDPSSRSATVGIRLVRPIVR